MQDSDTIRQIHKRHACDPVWPLFNRASNAYWSFAQRVAEFFPNALKKTKIRNPFLAIGVLLTLFVTGFVVVTPLFMIIGPIYQIIITILATLASVICGLLGIRGSPQPDAPDAQPQTPPPSQPDRSTLGLN